MVLKIILQNDVEVCSAWYWVLFCLQVTYTCLWLLYFLTFSVVLGQPHQFLVVSVSVSHSTWGVWIWISQAVQRTEEEDEHWKQRINLRGFHRMDCSAHCLLFTLWYPRRHCWGPSWFRRWIHSRPPAPWDWCHPPGIMTSLISRLRCSEIFFWQEWEKGVVFGLHEQMSPAPRMPEIRNPPVPAFQNPHPFSNSQSKFKSTWELLTLKIYISI